jgi:hypothetical protein
MTSPRRRPDRPVESVQLRISFKADRATSARIKEAVPSAVLKNRGCEVTIEGSEAGEVADRARDVLEKLREALGPTELSSG